MKILLCCFSGFECWKIGTDREGMKSGHVKRNGGSFDVIRLPSGPELLHSAQFTFTEVLFDFYLSNECIPV